MVSLILFCRRSVTWQSVLLATDLLALFSRCIFIARWHLHVMFCSCVSYIASSQAKCLETGETVAIKKVLQDKRYKNRELQLLRLMDHPNVISLKHCFFSTTSNNELFLNLVMECVPETVHGVLKHYNSMNQRMPLIYIKLYTYQVRDISLCSISIAIFYPSFELLTIGFSVQIFRGLAYMHTVPRVCHRDLKPQNLLVHIILSLFHFVSLILYSAGGGIFKRPLPLTYAPPNAGRPPNPPGQDL